MTLTTPSDIISAADIIVVKVGSVLLVDPQNGLKKDWLTALAHDVAAMQSAGKQIVIVTSGSIAMGRKAMGISATDRPSSISLETKQAAAAIGQVSLMAAYVDVFRAHAIDVAQILLTPRDTELRRAHLNARATIKTLLSKGVIPVVNENDTVSTAEIRFGDNDRLASRVAQMIGADLVIQLSTTDGLYTADPRLDPEAAHVPHVPKLMPEHYALAGDAVAGLSTGGMKSKLEAARIATESGIPMMIAKGTETHALRHAASGDVRLTLFSASGPSRSARQKWILAHVRPTGKIIIDDGACKALRDGKSLLAAGVKHIDGHFERGDAVQVFDQSGSLIGTGLAAYDHDSAQKILGRKSHEIADILSYSRGDALIHKDDLVLSG